MLECVHATRLSTVESKETVVDEVRSRSLESVQRPYEAEDRGLQSSKDEDQKPSWVSTRSAKSGS